MPEPKRGKTAQRHYFHFTDAMRQLEWDLQNEIYLRERIPFEWHEIAKARAPSPKTKVTLPLERDVVKFFKSMGRGYQARINEVLRMYMHGRLAGLVDGPETPDRVREFLAKGERPELGDSERRMRALAERLGE